ncbi:bifunctional tRNA (5-methylaminomethyl-2-thiouridine)(34)-methyltransferase MnmD/FAD-dependent 5-carboxymethylaminomethyl-2-thiouridine(34) oxidoreductase MnmC [Plesiomonas shigelloides]|uniref:bifunctional tRNA (5-methylaminomethyl-2-thiouridine)(34)-methyltransferase MnmD/FAD-dependent 5-carboxymethylaminomethyl-2-thiouridine(34) oxidoreductase MnmC n=1 Tax=Plesiomonas shigelloides TaxID=703 RepID=UPI001C04CD59|nr:bifunctional tRNA (5-methylaminomethyl-2-thiouridine)(34)-methyltransferase MnmD/FAD-dependent 5-carboxymethylaminomethyl-2-thiouridine(34) oxidoreductase MnmC [Plesiomonas shigelloides]QWK95235.1 bifunctional tRNA (5-methylaminomethyl-2-thiouridine)(34)-methyltransferase MnmD/FAD-dependent 5-carboxymethylaminomethyl-2-thiouridine(34) oxidoreductase MnmC [Plesiomonas shigelloides]
MNTSSIQQATLRFNEQGTPVSAEFDDVYFSNQNGLEETRYVFLSGNQLPERWLHHPADRFIVAETGFGTGLNFLTLWQSFREFQRNHPDSQLKRLHFISTEKFPLSAADLALAHQSWPELAEMAAELRQNWPLPISGCQRLLLDQGRVILDVWFGDVNETFGDWGRDYEGQIDAWFLDGFAPSKNPDMWNEQLFAHMVRMAKPGSGTFATFTAAGFVRRGLQAAGFEITRLKGFRHKREMLCGRRPAQGLTPNEPAPWYARPAASSLQDVAIIGGGIASALLAQALLQRGAKVTLYCADAQAAQGASGNRQGALYPLLNGAKDPLARFFAHAFQFARQRYDALAAQGIAFNHRWCGVLQLAHNEAAANKQANLQQAKWPEAMVSIHSPESAETRAGVPLGFAAVEYPQGGWLCPAQLTANLLQHLQQQGLSIHYQHTLRHLAYTATGWDLQLEIVDAHEQHTNITANHAVVVLANGYRISEFGESEHLPVYPVRGQVSHIPTDTNLSQLNTVLCAEGYLTPVNIRGDQHCLGATYGRGDTSTDLRDSDQQENLAKLQRSLPDVAWAQQVRVSQEPQLEIPDARAAVRCATRDHLPLMGALPDYAATLAQYAELAAQLSSAVPVEDAPYYPDLFVLGALGSRGLTSAPLLAEVLAAQMNGEPLPLERDILNALNPNRYWVRKQLKGKPVQNEPRG